MSEPTNNLVKKPRRSHSFGGCDTCRRRHVKCDQVRPHCLTCKAVGVECAGYPKDLKWVTSFNASSTDSTDPETRSASRPLSSRRHLYSEKSRLSMNSALQSDLASRPVDESISELDTRSKNASAFANRSHAVGPFGLLDFSGTEKHAGTLSDTNVEGDFLPVDIPDTTSPHTTQSLESLNNVDDFLDWPDLFELDFASPDFAPTDNGYALPGASLYVEAPYDVGQTTSPQQAVPIQGRDRQSDHLPLPTKTSAPETSLREIPPADAQILLKHFNDQVVIQFSSLPPGEKPHWTILNVRSAVLTLANIMYIQTLCASSAAMANLMALLAMSAQHLAHQNASQHTQTASYWRKIGNSAIEHAKEHLQHSLKNEIWGPNRANYKDQLMAISAMLAFSVLYDRQQDARAYMIDSERLLRIRGLAKRTISRKARMLHHLYTWSRIVGESSYVLRNHDQSQITAAIRSYSNPSKKKRANYQSVEAEGSDSRPGHNPKLDDFLRLDSEAPDSDIDTNAQKDSDKGLRDIHLEDPRKYSGEMYPQLYGISETWLSLVSQTTRLANIMDSLDESNKRKDVDFLESLERRKQRLEHMVCSFAATNKLIKASTLQQASDKNHHNSNAQSGDETPRSCMVRALHSALVIFFYRRIFKVHPWILQDHVKSVVEALQDFDTSCQTLEVYGPGSPWPVFMAGCEAIAPLQRDYLSQWLERAYAKTGFSRFQIIKSCMLEVWKKRDGFGQPKDRSSLDKTWSWIHVSREQNIYLLLS